ncbi:chemotaxis protein [Alteribacillus iranensis]|uniref:Two-component system, chemotaxis family, response regulator CheV n=1 Tax=Alteribacillus iranensis TaxID=930128 RepID=A0A1I2B6Z0_9BACI|nr:chemotaxis protein [Alteribacillus iranensis]SFE51925.1 two-component system, chemotaxis family, response regulator CheV [Alteribacillus iranensis]
MNQSNILLESGTNELEIILFDVDGRKFGINVLKVREIIQPSVVTETPNPHPYVEGIINLRDEIIPVVDLTEVLHCQPSANPEQDKFIVVELNNRKAAFHVHDVSRIYRLTWGQIEKPVYFDEWENTYTIGVVKLENEMALLLDYEKIVMETSSTSPHSQMGPPAGEKKEERADKQILIAEDSPVLQGMLKDTLEGAGYSTVVFQDGKEAWEYLNRVSEDEALAYPDLIITDIEMPQMDGHHLTKHVKNHPDLHQLPVIIFSSLITHDLYHKGEKVGADAQISKPDIIHVLDKVDGFVI